MIRVSSAFVQSGVKQLIALNKDMVVQYFMCLSCIKLQKSFLMLSPRIHNQADKWSRILSPSAPRLHGARLLRQQMDKIHGGTAVFAVTGGRL